MTYIFFGGNTHVTFVAYALCIEEIRMTYCIWGNTYDLSDLRKHIRHIWDAMLYAQIHMSYLLLVLYLLTKYVRHIVVGNK